MKILVRVSMIHQNFFQFLERETKSKNIPIAFILLFNYVNLDIKHLFLCAAHKKNYMLGKIMRVCARL